MPTGAGDGAAAAGKAADAAVSQVFWEICRLWKLGELYFYVGFRGLLAFGAAYGAADGRKSRKSLFDRDPNDPGGAAAGSAGLFGRRSGSGRGGGDHCFLPRVLCHMGAAAGP